MNEKVIGSPMTFFLYQSAMSSVTIIKAPNKKKDLKFDDLAAQFRVADLRKPHGI